jgi:hypothetical protein
MSARRVDSCLACAKSRPTPVFSLGETPLANRFLREDELEAPEPRFPLELVYCEGCGLLQLSTHVDPEVLFRDYAYVTGASSTMERHHRALADDHVAAYGLRSGDLVVDVASNDGSLLRSFRDKGCRVLGVEPARNLAAVANENGIPTLELFFGAAAARDVRRAHGPARHVSANNVAAHVPDLSGFLEGLRILAEPDGVVSVEAPYLGPMLKNLEYDTIYHEHLSYFAVRPFAAALARAGLGIVALKEVAVHGGTMRYVARPNVPHAPIVDEILAREEAAGFSRIETYSEFGERAERNRQDLRAFVFGLKREGRSLAAYGAAAKGMTLLNYAGIGRETFDFVVDRSPFKQEKYTPGMRLPILKVEELSARRPDAALLLPWNLTEEIVAQESGYRAKGGRFFVPIPTPRFVE